MARGRRAGEGGGGRFTQSSNEVPMEEEDETQDGGMDNEDTQEQNMHGSTAATAVNKNTLLGSGNQFYHSNVSYQSTNVERTLILQPLEQLKEMLHSLLQKLKGNKEEMPEPLLLKWKDKIIDISKRIITIQLEYDQMDTITNDHLNAVIQKENSKYQNNTQSLLDENNTELPSSNEMSKEIKKKIDLKLQKMNVLDDNYMKKILQISKKIVGGQDNDDLEGDLEILDNDEDLTENHFLCPYTRVVITRPVKK
jgi:hypothetical protein